MTSRDDLIDAIEQIISQASSVGYAEPSATNDVYENYVWAICLQAARQQGAAVSYQTVHDATASRLIFRTAPGAIYSVAHEYTHAAVNFPGCPSLEIHVGVKVTGKSRVLHECDVAVIDRAEAQLCRAEQVHPRASKVLIAAECKFYTSAIQLHLGRGFLGLTSDIHRKQRYFITNSHAPSVTRLINHHEQEWDSGVLPNTQESDALAHSFARAFRNYRAAY